MTAPSQHGHGDLEIVEEKTLLVVPRGEREELRLTFTRARMADGRETAWHGFRVWYRAEDGTMRPGKAGVTIRGRELAPVAVALLRAVASSIPAELHGAAKSIVAALESKTGQPPAPARSAAPPAARAELPDETYARLCSRRRIK